MNIGLVAHDSKKSRMIPKRSSCRIFVLHTEEY